MVEEGESGGDLTTFVSHYGWQYVVFQMAAFYRESRNDQYKKGLMEFYNDCSFMKDHEEWQIELRDQAILDAKNGRSDI